MRFWILLPLFLFTSCTDAKEELVETCIGGNASFVWDYVVKPFHAIEWHFQEILMAGTLKNHLSQDSLDFSNNYKSRFVLLEREKCGFSLINVTLTDEGDYKCILVLKGTSKPVELKEKLRVTDCNTHSTSTSRPVSGEGTTPTKPTLAEDDNTIVAIALGVSLPIVFIAICITIVYCLYRRKKKGDTKEIKDVEMTNQSSTPTELNGGEEEEEETFLSQ